MRASYTEERMPPNQTRIGEDGRSAEATLRNDIRQCRIDLNNPIRPLVD
jgi:hypothetical protein